MSLFIWNPYYTEFSSCDFFWYFFILYYYFQRRTIWMKQSTCLSLCQKGKQMYFSFKLFSQMKVFKHIIPKLASMRVMSHLWNTLQMAQQWLAIFATKGLTGDWSWDPFISSSTVWPLDHWSIYLQKLKIWYLMYFLLLPNAKKIFIWCFF